MTNKTKNNCPECQFENGEHSQECPKYKEQDLPMPKSNKDIVEERSKYWNELVDILEREFPKHKCQERGQALVLLAYAEMALKKQKSQLLKEYSFKYGRLLRKEREEWGKELAKRVEKMRKEIKKGVDELGRPVYPTEAFEIRGNIGYNQALSDLIKIIK